MLYKYLVICFDHINDTYTLKLVQHNGMSKKKKFSSNMSTYTRSAQLFM